MRKLSAICMTVVMAFSMLIMPVKAETVVLPAQTATPSEGCVFVGVPGQYLTDTQNVINRINQIRKEACDQGYANPNNGKALTASDYVPIKWSSQLESIARIRVVEAGIAFMHSGLKTGHRRLNAPSTNPAGAFDITYPAGVTPGYEVIAYNTGTSVLAGVEQWYSEISVYNKTNGWYDQDAGHYAALINPENTYIGLACFYSGATSWANTTLAQLGSGNQLDETQQAPVADCLQKTDVHISNIASWKIYFNTLAAGKTVRCDLKAKIDGMKKEVLVTDTVTWSSSDPTVASMDAAGNLTGIKPGTVTVTAQAGGKIIKTSVTVRCGHTNTEIRNAVAATTSKTGYTGDTYCKDCGEKIADGEKIPKLTEDSRSDDEASDDTDHADSSEDEATVKTTSGVKISYKINADKKSVTFAGVKTTEKGTLIIPATVKINGKIYRVTKIAAGACKNQKRLTKVVIGKNVKTIGKNAFSGCKQLKRITITTKLFKQGSIGKKAFSGIASKAVIKVPKSKLKTYKKLLKAAGVSSKAKIQK